MSSETKKATIQDLIAQKLRKSGHKSSLVEIKVPSLGLAMDFQIPSDVQILETLDSIKDDSSQAVYDAYRDLIYRCCPLLAELAQSSEHGAVNPPDIVSDVMNIDDVLSIGAQLVERTNFENRAKNS